MRTAAPVATAASKSWGDVTSLTFAILYLLSAVARRLCLQCQHDGITVTRWLMLVGTCDQEPSGCCGFGKQVEWSHDVAYKTQRYVQLRVCMLSAAFKHPLQTWNEHVHVSRVLEQSDIPLQT